MLKNARRESHAAVCRIQLRVARRRMFCEYRKAAIAQLPAVTLVTSVARFTILGATHRSANWNQKNYVKETLQRPPDVLLSGPFKKVSHTVFRDDFYRSPRIRSSGADQRKQVTG